MCGAQKLSSSEPVVNVVNEEDLKMRSLELGTQESTASAAPDVLQTLEQHQNKKLGLACANNESGLISVQKNIQPRLAGIGIAFETRGEPSCLVVHSFKPGGAAEPLAAQGVIKPGDELMAVDGIEILGKRGREIASLLIGDDGSRVRVTFLRYMGGSRDRAGACEVSVDITRRAPPAVESRAASIPQRWAAAGPL